MFSVHGPCPGIIFKTFGTARQLRELDWSVEVSHGKFAVEEELEAGL
jgi:hypothetical protein